LLWQDAAGTFSANIRNYFFTVYNLGQRPLFISVSDRSLLPLSTTITIAIGSSSSELISFPNMANTVRGSGGSLGLAPTHVNIQLPNFLSGSHNDSSVAPPCE